MKRLSGKLITFEGIEGSGKSTHCRSAAQYLRRKGYRIMLVREPGGTRIGEKIRRILLDRKNMQMAVESELLLYNAARIQLMKEKIIPALRQGMIVICDRFVDSTIAYQCFGGKLNRTIVERVNAFATFGIIPAVTFILDSNVRRGLKRARRSDRMELKSMVFHQRVRKGFLTLARKNKNRFCLIKEIPLNEGRMVIQRRLNALFK